MFSGQVDSRGKYGIIYKMEMYGLYHYAWIVFCITTGIEE